MRERKGKEKNRVYLERIDLVAQLIDLFTWAANT